VRFVVTGATGHLGPYVVARLAEQGHQVVATSRSGELPELPFGCEQVAWRGLVRPLALDLTRDEAVSMLRAELGTEVGLIHLAAWHPAATAITGASERRDLLDTNVHGTMRVLDAARRPSGVSSVVYSSSFEVYGVVEDAPIGERARVAPLSDYGATKLSGEDHLLSFGYEEDMRVVALRFPAIYGPGESTSRALPNFLRAVAFGNRPIIYGDGSDQRDQIHVRDAAEAVVQAALGSGCGIFNVADGEPHTVADIACTALRLAHMVDGPRMEARQKTRRDWHMSIDRARAELGFEPKIALHDGMAEELAWIRSLEPPTERVP
jgi:nucleoside-diphosphate-sugar epimerase